MIRFFLLGCFFLYSIGSTGQNKVRILFDESIIDQEIKYFPTIKKFPNILYGHKLLPNSDGAFYLDLKGVENRTINFTYKKFNAEIYVGKNDSIEIFIGEGRQNLSFKGENALMHEAFNQIMDETFLPEKRYHYLFNFKNSNLTPAELILEIAKKVKNEQKRIHNLLNPTPNSFQCYEVYLNTLKLSMLAAVKAEFPQHLEFYDYFDEILKILNINHDIINKSSAGFHYYYIYYKVGDISYASYESFTEPWLKKYSDSILKAPGNVKDYLIQCQYIGEYNTMKINRNWCDIYKEITSEISIVFFKDFFKSHFPCD